MDNMKTGNSIQFGRAIRERRKELGYTQRDLASFTGLSISFISDLERGKKTAELEKTLFIAGMLGLDVVVEPRGVGR